MAIEMSSDSAICYRCGMKFGKRRGFFPVSYSALHKGIGYMPFCRNCIDEMYNSYLAQCNNSKLAMRQMCRKLDLFWDESVYEEVINKSSTHSVYARYIARLNSTRFAGLSYDDTLSNAGTLWSFDDYLSDTHTNNVTDNGSTQDEAEEDVVIPQELIEFWGSGYTSDMYDDLERRRSYWISKLPAEIIDDVATEAIIKQICSLELDINRDRAAGKSVEKSITALINLLGSANLKPAQKKEGIDSSLEKTPFGVWIKRWEDMRPIPDPDPEFQDVDGIIRYISIWFFGHLCKMLGIKNSYCQLYEDEMEKMRVDHPEYEDDDDEALFNDIFGNDGQDDYDGEQTNNESSG